MMKKGINIWSFPQGTIKDSLTLAKKAGFEGVELALNGGKPVLGKKNVEYFVIDVGKSVSGIKDNGRTLGEIAEVWSEGRK